MHPNEGTAMEQQPPGLLLSQLGDTAGKRLRESRKETTHPAQSVFSLMLWITRSPWAQQSLCPPQGQEPGAETHVVWSRNASGCRNLHFNERYKALVMNTFQRGSNRKGGTHPSLQQGFLLHSPCSAPHPCREGRGLSWGCWVPGC